MITLPILIYLLAMLLIYFAADALHDVWVLKERSYFANSKRADLSPETRAEMVKKHKYYSRMWHALDAAIKGFMIANVVYWIMGFDWWLVWLCMWSVAVRWLWFDACWNWFAKVGFWYRGSVAQSDTLKISDWLFFTLKFALFIGSTTIIVLLIL